MGPPVPEIRTNTNSAQCAKKVRKSAFRLYEVFRNKIFKLTHYSYTTYKFKRGFDFFWYITICKFYILGKIEKLRLFVYFFIVVMHWQKVSLFP